MDEEYYYLPADLTDDDNDEFPLSKNLRKYKSAVENGVPSEHVKSDEVLSIPGSPGKGVGLSLSEVSNGWKVAAHRSDGNTALSSVVDSAFSSWRTLDFGGAVTSPLSAEDQSLEKVYSELPRTDAVVYTRKKAQGDSRKPFNSDHKRPNREPRLKICSETRHIRDELTGETIQYTSYGSRAVPRSNSDRRAGTPNRQYPAGLRLAGQKKPTARASSTSKDVEKEHTKDLTKEDQRQSAKHEEPVAETKSELEKGHEEPGDSTIAPEKPKESQKSKRKSKKANASKDSPTEISGKKAKQGMVDTLTDWQQDIIIADAASRVEAHRQEWARKLENAAERFGRSFEKGGHSARGRKDSHGNGNSIAGPVIGKVGEEGTSHTSVEKKKDGKTCSKSLKRSQNSEVEGKVVEGKAQGEGVNIVSGWNSESNWIVGSVLVLLSVMSSVVYNMGTILKAIVRWHMFAVAGVLLDIHAVACFAFMYFLPAVLDSVDAGILPTWSLSCLWYIFLLQICFFSSSNRIVGLAQTVLPFTLLTSSGKAEAFIVRLNGGERLLVAYFLSSMKAGKFNESMTYISLGVQLLLTSVFCLGKVRVGHWILFLIGSGTIFSHNETKKRMSILQSHFPKGVESGWESLQKLMHSPSSSMKRLSHTR
ncbi:hypothetical protein NDN08_008289 [Rhodosorus marinus]|uniref:Reticulon-like protein n=1 Tax=Rhodosorus marinus TaxID=101924 RepID=A0AAV8V010_9RHOD|nr:hypothetical protein NDN08_008289 [Rhodosorus marinus]